MVGALVDLGEMVEAGQIVTALAELQEASRETNRSSAAVLRARAKVCCASGKYSEAKYHALGVYGLTAGYNTFRESRGSIDVVKSYFLISEAEFLDGLYDDALHYLQQADVVLERISRQEIGLHYLVGELRWARGKSLLAQHKAAEAVEELRAAEALYVEQFGEKHPHWHLDAVRVALGRALEES